MNKELKFLIYNTPDEDISINATVKDETIWLTQKAMAELFAVQTPAISKHLKNIFQEGELLEEMVISKMETTTQHGAILDKTQTKATNFYNLDAIISVGYRVNSGKATNFRIWATGILKEYMIKGFAITGQTAAEIIDIKADRAAENMGLITWKNSPDGRILKSDVTVAKNYLNEKEIRQLERAVTGYFDYIEDLIERENTFTMEAFAKSINDFLTFRKYDVLQGKGSISKKLADQKAKAEYDAFNKTQKINSDFDQEIKKLLQKGGGLL